MAKRNPVLTRQFALQFARSPSISNSFDVAMRQRKMAAALISVTLLLPFWSSAVLPLMQWAFSDYLQSNGKRSMPLQSEKYTAYSTAYFNNKNSETCQEGAEPNHVRFVCPRQNEPRDFLYCCKINGSEMNLTCCADKTLSKYPHAELDPTVPQNAYSYTEMIGQIVIGLYMIFVIALMAIDFFSHMKLRKSAEDQQDMAKKKSGETRG